MLCHFVRSFRNVIALVSCFFLNIQTIPELSGEKLLYHFEDDTVILPCEQLPNGQIVWQGPKDYTTYGYGEIIDRKISKFKRLSIKHVNGSLQYNLQIRHFSSEDEGQYKCIRSASSKGVEAEFYILKIGSK